MAFDERIKELEAALNALPVSEHAEVTERTDAWVDQVQTEPSVMRPDEKNAIQSALNSYSTERLDHFSKLVESMDKSDSGEAWISESKNARQSLERTFATALSDVATPTITALNFVFTVVTEEQAFYASLEAAQPAASVMDTLSVYRSDLTAGIQVLQEIWEQSSNDADRVMRDEDAVAAEVKELVDKVAGQAAESHRAYIELGLEVVKQGGVELVTTGINIALTTAGTLFVEALRPIAEFFLAYRGEVEVRKVRFKEFFESHHAAMLITFKGARDQAKRFKDDHDYDKLGEVVQTARRALDEFTSQETRGLKKDAEDLSTLLRDKIDKAYQSSYELWDDFVRKNQVKFFGPLGPDLDQALLGSKRWSNFYSTISASNLQQLLGQWVSEARELREVINRSDNMESWQPGLRAALLDNLETYIKTEEETAQVSGDQAVAEYHREKFKQLEKTFNELG